MSSIIELKMKLKLKISLELLNKESKIVRIERWRNGMICVE